MKFNAPDMSCGHCKASVETAVHTLDKAADIAVDLTAKTVTVTGSFSGSDIQNAVAAKGFTATLVAE